MLPLIALLLLLTLSLLLLTAPFRLLPLLLTAPFRPLLLLLIAPFRLLLIALLRSNLRTVNETKAVELSSTAYFFTLTYTHPNTHPNYPTQPSQREGFQPIPKSLPNPWEGT